MKAKVLNPLQENMRFIVNQFAWLISHDCIEEPDEKRVRTISGWFGELVLAYALTVASGNDTYLKCNKSVLDEHLEHLFRHKEIYEGISQTLSEMIELLNA